MSITMNDPNQSEIEKKELCAVCKIVAKNMCGKCKIVYYCSREHQKYDWKVHRKTCRIIKLIEDPTIGHRSIATRDIEVDEIVLREDKPLLKTPGVERNCLSCYAVSNESNPTTCEKCGWQLCRNCTQHGPECELTMRYRKKKIKMDEDSDSDPVMLHSAILILRVLALRENNPEAYQKFMNLGNRRIGVGIRLQRIGTSEWKDYLRHFKKLMKIDNLDEENILKILEIAEVNEISVFGKGKRHVSFFAKVSYIEHSCRANCYMVNTADDGIVVRAAVNIPKGHPVTVSYVNPMEPTNWRRFSLQILRHVNCICERCSDPTALGTMFDAVKCNRKNCTGYMLPPTFLVQGEDVPDFVCDKCNAKRQWLSVSIMMQEIKNSFSKVNQLDVNQVMKFIVDQRKVLHENHQQIFYAKFVIASIFSQQNGFGEPASDELLKKHLTLCKELTELLEILMPAQYSKRGMVLLAQWLTMEELRHRQKPSLAEYGRLIKESLDVLIESHRLATHEPGSLFTEDSLKDITDRLHDMKRLYTFLTDLLY